MKDKLKKVFIVFSILVVFSIFLILIYSYINKQNLNNYLYKIHYFEDYIPGYNYDIYFLNNNKIIVISQSGCSTLECSKGTYSPDKEKTTIHFNKENMTIIWKWADSLFNDNELNRKDLELDSLTISQENKKFIDSIINNNENLLFVNG